MTWIVGGDSATLAKEFLVFLDFSLSLKVLRGRMSLRDASIRRERGKSSTTQAESHLAL